MLGATALVVWHLPAWSLALRNDQRRIDAAIEYWSSLADDMRSESLDSGERRRKAS
jgi:hypothetical protein